MNTEKTSWGGKLKYKAISCLSLAAFLVLWWLLTDVWGVANTALLPSPVTVFQSFVAKLTSPNPDGAVLGVHILASLKGVGLG